MDRLQKEARLKELTEGKDQKVKRFQEIQSAIDSGEREAAEKKLWLELLKNDIEALQKRILGAYEEISQAQHALNRAELEAINLCSFKGSTTWTPAIETRAKEAQETVSRLAARLEELVRADKDAKAESEEKRKTAIRFETRISSLGEKIEELGQEKEAVSGELGRIEAEIGRISEELQSP